MTRLTRDSGTDTLLQLQHFRYYQPSSHPTAAIGVTSVKRLRALGGRVDTNQSGEQWLMPLEQVHILHARLAPNLEKLLILIDDEQHIADVNDTLQALWQRSLEVRILRTRGSVPAIS